jgi:hypothetical protein
MTITTAPLGHRTFLVRTACLAMKNQHPNHVFGPQAVAIWLRDRPPCDLHESVAARIYSRRSSAPLDGKLHQPQTPFGQKFREAKPIASIRAPG